MKASFIVGPLFFKEVGPAGPVTCMVNDKRTLFRNQVIPTLQQLACLDRIIFMRNGVPLHIAKAQVDATAQEVFRKS